MQELFVHTNKVAQMSDFESHAQQISVNIIITSLSDLYFSCKYLIRFLRTVGD